jgi:hypothetical protein
MRFLAGQVDSLPAECDVLMNYGSLRLDGQNAQAQMNGQLSLRLTCSTERVAT